MRLAAVVVGLIIGAYQSGNSGCEVEACYSVCLTGFFHACHGYGEVAVVLEGFGYDVGEVGIGVDAPPFHVGYSGRIVWGYAGHLGGNLSELRRRTLLDTRAGCGRKAYGEGQSQHGGCFGTGFARHSLGEVVDHDEEERNVYYAYGYGHEHAEKDAGAYVAARGRARTGGEHERQQAEGECQRCHHDGAETQPRGGDGGFYGVGAARGFFGCEFHYQDGVLGHEADEHHEPDLEIDVVFEPAQPHSGIGAESRHGQRHYHGHGYAPAFVLCGEHEEHEQECQSEYHAGVGGLMFLLVAQAAPFHSDVVGKVLAHYFLQRGHGFARAVSAGGFAAYGGGVEHVEARDGAGAGGIVCFAECGHGHHGAGAAAQVEQVQVVAVGSVLRIGLHVYSVDAVEHVEVVDVDRTGECLHG